MKVEEKTKVLQRMIYLSAGLILMALLFKIFGSKIFETAVNNPTIISISDYIQTHIWLDIPIKFALYAFGTFMYMKTVCYNENNKKFYWLYFLLITLIWTTKYFNLVIGFILELAILVGLPIIINKQWYRGIIGYGILIIFQMISLYARGFDLSIISGNYLLLTIFEIDYYFMLLTSYLYVKMINLKMEGNNMLIGIAFLSTKEKQLTALRDNEAKRLEKREQKFDKYKQNKLRKIEKLNSKIEIERSKHAVKNEEK